MISSSKPLINVSELKRFPNAVIIDARGGPDARDRYNKGHVPGALFVDLETQLSEKSADPKVGGRHPLPKIETFTNLLGDLGIANDTPVIVYDDKLCANAAARFWWMMRAAGHQHIKVIDGGLQAIVKSGVQLSTDSEQTPQPVKYSIDVWVLPVSQLSEVAEASKNNSSIIIDVREAYRYNGESEPIDKIAGHIPGAVNVPYFDSLSESGEFLPEEQLRDKFYKIVGSKPENVIVHCGSGVTACHTMLAMEQAGFRGARLYVGSWSEWSRNNMTMVTKNIATQDL